MTKELPYYMTNELPAVELQRLEEDEGVQKPEPVTVELQRLEEDEGVQKPEPVTVELQRLEEDEGVQKPESELMTVPLQNI